MKNIFFICFTFIFSLATQAQVYEFHPIYRYEGNYFKEYKSLNLKRPDSVLCSFIFDLDAKTVSFSESPEKAPQIIRIRQVKEKDNIIDISIEPQTGEASSGYKLTMENTQILHCDYYETRSGVSGLVGHIVYLSDLRYVRFRHTSYSFIADTKMDGREYKIEEMYKTESTKFTYTDNVIEMQDAKITWTEGKGKKAIEHVYNVVEVAGRGNGIAAACFNEDKTALYVFYYHTDKNYPYPEYVSISKYDYNAENPDKSMITEHWLFR